ncbi:MAG TPA: hypothetical protein VF239_03795, partial [Vicinamibacterales bacterium]
MTPVWKKTIAPLLAFGFACAAHAQELETEDTFPSDPFLLTLDPAQSPDTIDADLLDAKSRP